MTDLSKVTRVTVIGTEGIAFEKYKLYDEGCFLSVQDEGRTLKIFPSQRLQQPSERLRLRYRIKGALHLLALAVKILLNEEEARRFVHVLNLGMAARKQELTVSSAWLFGDED